MAAKWHHVLVSTSDKAPSKINQANYLLPNACGRTEVFPELPSPPIQTERSPTPQKTINFSKLKYSLPWHLGQAES
jgi:hypothetical protein